MTRTFSFEEGGCVVKIRSWTRRLREIRAVGGPGVGWGGKSGGHTKWKTDLRPVVFLR